VTCLVRRADTVAVIGAALTWSAAGWGHRRIPIVLGRAASTVRGWVRRFAARAGPLRSAFTVLACDLDPDPWLPDPAGSVVADAVAAIVTAAKAAVVRWGRSVFTVSPWRLAAVTSGRLLTPLSTVDLTNTSRPW
jgi:hypothetical protein